MSVTIKDLARITGFSINTISRALKDKPDVKPQTKEKILAAAKEAGYVANALAGSLRHGRRNVIGALLSADSSNPVFAEMIVGIENQVRERGYSIILINTEQDADKQLEGANLLVSQQVDGLVIMPVADRRLTDEVYRQLPCPFIFLGRNINGLLDHSVLFDDAAGAREALGFFYSQGIEDVLLLSGPAEFCSTIDRLEGYRAAAREHGLLFDESSVYQTDGHMAGGYEAVIRALDEQRSFSAICAYNDLCAYGALRALHDRKIAVPEEVQVIGYDNLEISRFFTPSLTSMATPRLEIGRLAARELIDHIEDEEHPYQTVSLRPQLVLGESTL